MSTASTQRLAAFGSFCRRPSALLVPFAPLVLLAFAGLLLVSSVRAARLRAAASSTMDAAAAPVAEPIGFVRRGVAAIRPSRAIGAAAALFGGILIAASMAGGTYAFLNAQKTTPATTVSSGSLAVTVQYGTAAAGTTAAIPATAWANMLPGDFVGQQITIASSGTANSTVTARLSATTAWAIRVATGACPATQLTGAALTTTAATLTSLAAGASSVVCVQATLPAGVAASAENTAANFTILLDATQVSP